MHGTIHILIPYWIHIYQIIRATKWSTSTKWMVWEMKQIFNAHALCMLGFWLSSDIARRIAFLFLVYEGVFSEKFNGRLWYENNYHNYCCINLIVHILRRLNFNHCHIYILYAWIRERFHAIYDGIFEIAMNLKTVNNRMSRAGEIHKNR